MNEQVKKTVSFLGVPLFFLVFLYQIYIEQTPGVGAYAENIKSTKNMIAYTYYSLSASGDGDPKETNIYLVNAESGEKSQVNSDDYDDASISWSPSGDELIFTSQRSRKSTARHDNLNPEQLFIYDFKSNKETSLEQSITQEIFQIAAQFKEDGGDVGNASEYLAVNSQPHWFAEGRIGFKRELYFGDTYGYGELCSTDSLGKKLKIHRPVFEKRKWQVVDSQWINEDSLIVNVDGLASSLDSPLNIAFYFPKEKNMN